MEDNKHSTEFFIIKDINETNRSQTFDLAWRIFNKFEAPEYSKKGIESFHNALHDPEYISQLKIYGAFNSETIVGMLATRNKGNHIALFFVDDRFHRKGIGKRLFETALNNCLSKEMTVNSSPYAIEVYHALGFTNTDVEQISDGIRYIPMIYKRN